jgi:hypothetical protein
MSRLTASNFPTVCGVRVVTCTRNARERAILLVDEEEPHPSNYQGCRHAKEEMWKRKLQKASKTTTTPHHSKTTLHGGAMQKHTATAAASAALSWTDLPRYSRRNEYPPLLRHTQQQVPIQSVRAPNANSSSLNDKFKVLTMIFQHIMTA